MFSFYTESPLPVSDTETYQGMAFDGCRYYLTVQCACRIAVLDKELCLIGTVQTRRPYGAICYDPRRDCFWAASDQCRFVLFKLDRRFQEIDRFEPRIADGCPQPLSDVSFCCESGLLLVSCGKQLLEVDPEGGEVRFLCEAEDCTLILSAVCLSPYLLFSALQDSTACFFLASRDGEILAEQPAPEALRGTALVVEPGTCDLLLLTSKHECYPYLFHARFAEEIAETLHPCPEDLYCGEEEPEPCDPPCACGALLESIALVEAGLAHILNAEGEKLQKAIRREVPSRELLEINESVQKTIRYATQLEQVLLSKLEAVQNICGTCEKE